MKKRAVRNNETIRGYVDILRLLKSNSEFGQSYEALLGNLQLLSVSRPCGTILVTSTQPEEGKSTVTLGLALAMMLVGKKVLVFDSDLRKPRIHQLLGLDNKRGAADVMDGSLGVQDVIQALEIADSASPGNKQTLGVITSGKVSPNALQLVANSKLKIDLDKLKTLYDCVLLDSAPVLAVSDPLLLAPLVDGIIIVLSPGAVTEKDAKLAKERLEQAGGHILGVVMNRFNEALHGPGFHPYNDYYVSS
jgi:capsular exopolysaccharide synthesis family protein